MVHCSNIWRGYFFLFYCSATHCHWNSLPSNVRWKSLWNRHHRQVGCLNDSIEHGSVSVLLIFIHLWSNLRCERQKSHTPHFRRTNTSRGNEDMIGLMTCNTSILCDVLFHFFLPLLLIFHNMVDFFCQSFEVWAYHFGTSTNTNTDTKWIYSNPFWVQDKFEYKNDEMMKSCANLGLSKRILHVRRSQQINTRNTQANKESKSDGENVERQRVSQNKNIDTRQKTQSHFWIIKKYC